jgi:hypothetical protein
LRQIKSGHLRTCGAPVGVGRATSCSRMGSLRRNRPPRVWCPGRAPPNCRAVPDGAHRTHRSHLIE